MKDRGKRQATPLSGFNGFCRSDKRSAIRRGDFDLDAGDRMQDARGSLQDIRIKDKG